MTASVAGELEEDGALTAAGREFAVAEQPHAREGPHGPAWLETDAADGSERMDTNSAWFKVIGPVTRVYRSTGGCGSCLPPTPFLHLPYCRSLLVPRTLAARER